MARHKKSAYGDPQESREVVISMDRRLMYIGGLVLVFVIAIGIGAWTRYGGASAPERVAEGVAEGQPEATGEAPLASQLSEAEIRGTAEAQGLPTSMVILTPMVPEPLATQMGSEGGGSDLESELPDWLPEDMGGVELDIPPEWEGKAAEWPPDVLANFEDPNVTDPDYSPLRLEEVEGTLSGPRVAIADLNELNTYNFGTVPIDTPIAHGFEARNVGDEDLIISRVYSACGCTATRIGELAIDSAGWIKPDPLVLAPGESVVFGIEFDPRVDNVRGSQAKYVQVFSNDPTRAVFDPADPLSHEVRFRLVVDPE